MSTNQLGPQFLTVNGVALNAFSMDADFVTDTLSILFNDNPDIQVAWTGTPTGTIVIQVSLDPVLLGWQTIPFSPAAAQPTGSDGSDYFSINQTGAEYIRLSYTATSGTGTITGKIAAKSV